MEFNSLVLQEDFLNEFFADKLFGRLGSRNKGFFTPKRSGASRETINFHRMGETSFLQYHPAKCK